METIFYATNNGYTTTYTAYINGERQGTVSESELKELYSDHKIFYKNTQYIVSDFFDL